MSHSRPFVPPASRLAAIDRLAPCCQGGFVYVCEAAAQGTGNPTWRRGRFGEATYRTEAEAMRLRPLWLLATVAALFVGERTMLASHNPSAGEVSVIDGDTLQVGGEIVQLYGIDAPELGQICYVDGEPQSCGVEAALALRKLIALAEPSFHCSPWQDGSSRAAPPGTTVQVCEAGDRDVGLVLLHGGYSVALPGSFPDYAKAQEQAQEAGLGLWHSEFVPPWAWRRGERLPGEPTACNIKATTSAEGRRVYYVPTDPAYDRTAIDPAEGDAWFCSDEEARLAGWRRPGEDADVD